MESFMRFRLSISLNTRGSHWRSHGIGSDPVFLKIPEKEGIKMRIENIREYTDNEKILGMAENCLKQIDESGSPESKYELAILLEELHNKNLNEDIFELFKGAAEDDANSGALLKLSKYYHAGRGCQRNIARSFAYCYEAARLGDLDAETYLAQIFRDDWRELALYWAEHAGNRNDPQALMIAGDLLDRLGATRKNGQKYYDGATRCYEKAASLGVAGAKNKVTVLGKLLRVLRFS